MFSRETQGMLLGFLGVFSFGLTLPITRIVVPYMSPWFIGLGRAVVAALIAAVLLAWFRAPLPSLRQGLLLLVVSLGVIIGYPLLSAWAMQYVHASHGGVVLGILPIATSLFGVLFTRERPSMGFWLVSGCGSLLVVVYAYLHAEGAFQPADLAMLLAVILAALGFALGGRLTGEIGGWQTICWSLVLSLPFILVPALLLLPDNLSAIPHRAWQGFLYLALMSQLFGFVLWNKGLALGGVVRVSQMQMLQPFITIIGAVLILGERLELLTIAFTIIVVIAIALSRKMKVKQAAPALAAPGKVQR